MRINIRLLHIFLTLLMTKVWKTKGERISNITSVKRKGLEKGLFLWLKCNQLIFVHKYALWQRYLETWAKAMKLCTCWHFLKGTWHCFQALHLNFCSPCFSPQVWTKCCLLNKFILNTVNAANLTLCWMKAKHVYSFEEFHARVVYPPSCDRQQSQCPLMSIFKRFLIISVCWLNSKNISAYCFLRSMQQLEGGGQWQFLLCLYNSEHAYVIYHTEQITLKA